MLAVLNSVLAIATISNLEVVCSWVVHTNLYAYRLDFNAAGTCFHITPAGLFDDVEPPPGVLFHRIAAKDLFLVQDLGRSVDAFPDRKSTRLNSSH